MTKRQLRKIVHEACELVESGEQFYSCTAFASALGSTAARLVEEDYGIYREYTLFYGQEVGYWLGYDGQAWNAPIPSMEKRHLRVMFLLNFLEGYEQD